MNGPLRSQHYACRSSPGTPQKKSPATGRGNKKCKAPSDLRSFPPIIRFVFPECLLHKFDLVLFVASYNDYFAPTFLRRSLNHRTHVG